MLAQPLGKKPGRDRKILVMRAGQAAAIFARFGFRRRMVGDGVLRRQRAPSGGERRSRRMAGRRRHLDFHSTKILTTVDTEVTGYTFTEAPQCRFLLLLAGRPPPNDSSPGKALVT